MHISVTLSTVTRLCNRHHQPSPEFLSSCRTKTHVPMNTNSPPPPPPPSPWHPPFCCLCQGTCEVQPCRLVLLSLAHSTQPNVFKGRRVATCVRISFLNSISLHTPRLVSPSIHQWTLVPFLHPACWDECDVSMSVQIPLGDAAFRSLDVHAGVGLLDHGAVLFLMF